MRSLKEMSLVREAWGEFSLLPDYSRAQELHPDDWEMHTVDLKRKQVKEIANSHREHLLIGSEIRRIALGQKRGGLEHAYADEFRELMIRGVWTNRRSDVDAIVPETRDMVPSRTDPRAKHAKGWSNGALVDRLSFPKPTDESFLRYWTINGINYLGDSFCAIALPDGKLLLYDPYDVFHHGIELSVPNLNIFDSELHSPIRIVKSGIHACFHLIYKPIPDFLTRQLRSIGGKFALMETPQAYSIWDLYEKMNNLPACINETAPFLSNLLATGLFSWIALAALYVHEQEPSDLLPLHLMNGRIRELIEHCDDKRMWTYLPGIYPGPDMYSGKFKPDMTRHALMRFIDLHTSMFLHPEDMGCIVSNKSANRDYLAQRDSEIK